MCHSSMTGGFHSETTDPDVSDFVTVAPVTVNVCGEELPEILVTVTGISSTLIVRGKSSDAVVHNGPLGVATDRLVAPIDAVEFIVEPSDSNRPINSPVSPDVFA